MSKRKQKRIVVSNKSILHGLNTKVIFSESYNETKDRFEKLVSEKG